MPNPPPTAVEAADRVCRAAHELRQATPQIGIPFDTHAVTTRLARTVGDLSSASRALATWHTAHPQDAHALDLVHRLAEASAALASARDALVEAERISEEVRWTGRLA